MEARSPLVFKHTTSYRYMCTLAIQELLKMSGVLAGK